MVNRCQPLICQWTYQDEISVGRSNEGWRSWPNWVGQTEVAVLFQPQWPHPMAPRSLQWVSEWMSNCEPLSFRGVWSGRLCLSSPKWTPLLDGDWWSESWRLLRNGIRKAWITPSTNTPQFKVHKGKVDGLRFTPTVYKLFKLWCHGASL